MNSPLTQKEWDGPLGEMRLTPVPSMADRTMSKLTPLAQGSVIQIVSSLGHKTILLARAETIIFWGGALVPLTQKSVALSCIHRVRMLGHCGIALRLFVSRSFTFSTSPVNAVDCQFAMKYWTDLSSGAVISSFVLVSPLSSDMPKCREVGIAEQSKSLWSRRCSYDIQCE